MKKVFIIHGFEGSPNGGWRPWLMAELEKLGVYACALPMPSPEKPLCSEWVEEISRHIEEDERDKFYLVGHSLGVSAILRYLEKVDLENNIEGAVLVSGPLDNVGINNIGDFFKTPFDFKKIKQKVSDFAVIHGDNDDVVPLEHADSLAKNLEAELIVVPGGDHLTGSAGWYKLPQALDVLKRMFGKSG